MILEILTIEMWLKYIEDGRWISHMYLCIPWKVKIEHKQDIWPKKVNINNLPKVNVNLKNRLQDIITHLNNLN